MFSLHLPAHGRLIDALPNRASLRGSLAFAATLVLATMLALSAFLSFRASRERDAAEEWEVHTLNVLRATASLRLGSLGTLRGEQAYLLTGDPKFLEPYYAARAQVDRDVAALGGLVTDNSGQRSRLGLIEAPIRVHLNTVASLIALERAGRHDEAVRRIRAGENRHRIEAIMREIDRFETIERALLVERTEAARRASAQDALFEYLVCAVGLAMVGVASVAAVALRRSLLREAVVRWRAAAHRGDRRADRPRQPPRDSPRARLADRRGTTQRPPAVGRGARHRSLQEGQRRARPPRRRRGHPPRGAPRGRDHARPGSRGRLGGEEFVIAMPDTDLEHARRACERLRQALGELSILLPTGSAVNVTLSTGVTQFAGGEDRIQLIARADEALTRPSSRAAIACCWPPDRGSEQPRQQVEKAPRPSPTAGIVMNQATITFCATPQRTAEARRAVPAPMIAPVIVCVVDTGMPSIEAPKITIEPAVDALKPWCCDSLVIREPIVSMIFHPPLSVPSAIAM
jgi:CHASE3 domain sensor protein